MSMHKHITFKGLLWFHIVPLSHVSNLYTWDNVLQYHHHGLKTSLNYILYSLEADIFWILNQNAKSLNPSSTTEKSKLIARVSCLDGIVLPQKLSTDTQKQDTRKACFIWAVWNVGCCFQTLYSSNTVCTVSKQIIEWMTILWHCICLNQSAGCSSIHSHLHTVWWIIKHSSLIWPQGTHWYYASNTVQLFLAIKCRWFASAIAIR